jgi:hypothetical protein
MYSNQKDQIKLEDVYNNLHTEETVPDTGLGTAVVFGGFIFLAYATEFVLNRYRNFVKNKNIKELVKVIINNLKNNSELQEKVKNLKSEADASKNEEYTKEIKSLLYQYIKNDSNFSQNVENRYEDDIIKKILNLLPSNFSGKSESEISREVNDKIHMSQSQLQDQKRKSMGLPPVIPARYTRGL